MNKIPCDIIKDLLPLYKDEICSMESKDIIEEHLPECEDCRNYLEAMYQELPSVTPVWESDSNENGTASAINLDVDFLEKISRRVNWLKVMIVFFTLMVVWMAGIIVKNVVSSEAFANIPILDRRVPIKDVQVTELYQLEDGRLFFTLETDTFCDPFFDAFINSPDRLSNLENYDNGEIAFSLEKVSFFQRNILSRFGTKKFSFAFPPEEEYRYLDVDGTLKTAIHKGSAAYLVGKNNEQFSLWKKGQEIEAAPAEVEKRVAEAQKKQTGDYEADPTDIYTDGFVYVYEEDPLIILYDSAE